MEPSNHSDRKHNNSYERKLGKTTYRGYNSDELKGLRAQSFRQNMIKLIVLAILYIAFHFLNISISGFNVPFMH